MPATKPERPAPGSALAVPRVDDTNVQRALDAMQTVIKQMQSQLELFTAQRSGRVPAATGSGLFLRGDGTWATPASSVSTGTPFYDTVIDVTGTPITFGVAYDNWNVGTLGQTTLVKYITDGIPSGASSRQVRGVAGGALGKIISFMNMAPNPLGGVAQFQNEDPAAPAGSKMHNAGASGGGGSANGGITYYHDGTLWRQIWAA